MKLGTQREKSLARDCNTKNCFSRVCILQFLKCARLTDRVKLSKWKYALFELHIFRFIIYAPMWFILFSRYMEGTLPFSKQM